MLRSLEGTFGDLSQIWETPPSEFRTLGIPDVVIAALQSPDWPYVEKAMSWESEANHTLLCWHDSRYPQLLKECKNPPPLLYVEGNVDLLSCHQLAIVGSRHPTPSGLELAKQFAKHLSNAGLVVTSGLAYGVDSACHQGALMGVGKTVAVLGTGLNHIYPAKNKELAKQIASEGALVSEFPLDMTPNPANFPRRNRIISGLSLGVLVVEAAKRSGSLITARHASDEGREVFAIPGSIHNPLAKGCHWLIRQGAKLVEETADILEELGPLISVIDAPSDESNVKVVKPLGMSKEYEHLLESLDLEPTSIDTLVVRSGLTAKEVSSMLLALELDGIIKQTPGGFCRARYLS